MTLLRPAQQPLVRAVCNDRHEREVCVLLIGHVGKHTSSRGKQW